MISDLSHNCPSSTGGTKGANQSLLWKLAVSVEVFLVIVLQKVGFVMNANSSFLHHPT